MCVQSLARSAESPSERGKGRIYSSQLRSEKTNAMRRRLVWIETQRFRGWGCSECSWVFNPSGAPVGHSLDEMIQNYEKQREQEFASHDCAEYPRATKNLH
jgi:hypothetical protein